MPTDEKIILDPEELVSTREALDITCWIDQEGADWGEATIEPYMAQRERGEVPVDFRLPNREAQFPLVFKQTLGGTTTAAARAAFQSKVSLFQKEGGWLKRVLNTGGTVYADIVDASLAVTSWTGQESSDNLDLEATMTLNLLPDFYQDEITLADHTETTLPEITFSEASVLGDYPARVRIVVDNDQASTTQRGLLWGFRSRHYNSAVTAAPAYQAEALDPSGNAVAYGLAGASNGTIVRGTLYPAYTEVLSTNKGGTAYLTHTGSNRVWARVYNAGTVEADVRLRWDVGDGVNPVVNDPWTVPRGTAFYMADLGEIRLDPSPVGTHRWIGGIEAKARSDTTIFGIDRFYVVNADEGYGVLGAPVSSGLTNGTLAAFDDMTTHSTGGTLGALTAPLGGAWDDYGSGTDWLCTPTHVIRNCGTADASLYTGQYVVTGSSSLTATEVKANAMLSTIGSVPPVGTQTLVGVVARWVDINNWLVLFMLHHVGVGAGNRKKWFGLQKRVAGAVSELGWSDAGNEDNSWFTLKLSVDAAGNAYAYADLGAGVESSAAKITVTADANLAAGGALDNGKVGIVHGQNYASLPGYISGFQALGGAATPDGLIYASKSAQLTTDGMYRLDTGGTAYGPVSHVTGDLPRLPVAGMEGRTTQVFLKPSRGDFTSALPDAGIDDVSARVYYRPSYLTVGTI